jgi:hypothetical protein
VRRLAIALFGCSGELSIPIAPPPLEGAESFVLVIQPEGGPAIVEARQNDGSWIVRAELPREQPFDVFVLAYATDLEAIRLAEGTQEVVPGGRPLPDPIGIQRAQVEDGTPAPWEVVDTKPDVQIELPSESPCATLEATTLEIPDPRRPLFVADLGAGEVVIGTGSGALYRARSAGPVEAFTVQPPARALDGLVSEAELLVLTDGPCLYTITNTEASLRSCADTSSTATTTLGNAWLAGEARDASELVVVTDDGRIYAERSTTWSLLVSFGAEPSRKGGIAYLGDGHAIAAGPFGRNVARWRSDRVTIEPIRLSEADKMISVLDHLTLGPIAGSNFGVLVRDAAGEWSELAHPVTDEALVMAPLEDGLIVGGNKGSYVHVLADGAACPQVTLHPGDASEIIAVEGGFAAISSLDDAGYVIFLRVAD